MSRPDALEAALVDTLIPFLRGAGHVCVVGDLSPDARGRLGKEIGGRLAPVGAEAPASCDAAVVLDLDRAAAPHAWKTEIELAQDLELAAREREYDEEQLRNTIAERQNTINELRQDVERVSALLEAERTEHGRTRGLYEEVRAQLDRMESSVAWRWIVQARTTRQRMLPPGTWRGRLWDGLRGALRAFMR